MNFNLFNWTYAFPVTSPGYGVFRAPASRPRLVARWRRAPDGKLECRWENALHT